MLRSKNTVREKGNALFLILIAVILFAALSYAITQSNRSGGNASRETNLVAGTTVTQYPSAIRTAITRMLLRGVSASDIDFIDPADADFDDAPVTAKVFQNVDPNTVELDNHNVPLGAWTFLSEKVVTNIGTGKGDVVAVLTRVRTGICERINEQITGSTDIPASGLSDAQAIADAASDFTGAGITGQPFLCVSTTDNHNVYYHVLLEQ